MAENVKAIIPLQNDVRGKARCVATNIIRFSDIEANWVNAFIPGSFRKTRTKSSNRTRICLRSCDRSGSRTRVRLEKISFVYCTYTNIARTERHVAWQYVKDCFASFPAVKIIWKPCRLDVAKSLERWSISGLRATVEPISELRAARVSHLEGILIRIKERYVFRMEKAASSTSSMHYRHARERKKKSPNKVNECMRKYTYMPPPEKRLKVIAPAIPRGRRSPLHSLVTSALFI